MDFDTTTPDGGSYEKPKPGKYLGILIGFAYVGTQPGGQYDDRKMVLLRWELHKRNGPSLDSAGYTHTITKDYSATVKTDRSKLRQVLEAHRVVIPENGKTSSREWLRRAAWLDVEHSEDGKWANVVSVSKLDPEDDKAPEPTLDLDHWDDTDIKAGTKPPGWAAWKVARSLDIAHLAPPRDNATGSRRPVPAGAATEDDSDVPW